jgi:HAD superfamily phosphatase (TIGR01668 family)
MAFVSNNKGARVSRFNESLGLYYVCKAGKPSPKGVRRCIAHFGLPNDEVIAVGDQIFTDVMGARGCGVMSILVTAIDNHNIWLKARHVAELPFIFLARNRRMNYEES